VFTVSATCPICGEVETFYAEDDYASCRDSLHAPGCRFGYAATRERALADALFSAFPRSDVQNLTIHEVAPADRGISLWMQQNCTKLTLSGYFPGRPFGTQVGRLRNEDMEEQTFADELFDLVLHLDVMEHLFDPFAALNETYRTLVPKGICIFTTPTYEKSTSQQVAFRKDNGSVEIVGEPEYHGNPQSEDGSLVTWRYGYDLARLIGDRTAFDVEVRRWHSPQKAIIGPMTEVYLLRK
jgi:SAM-dependent methyltransferase